MESSKDPGHLKRLKQVSYKLNIPEEVIEQALNHTSEYIKNKISKVELEDDVFLTEEEFNEKFPVINIPNLGYLKPSYMKYKYIYNKIKEKKEKNNK